MEWRESDSSLDVCAQKWVIGAGGEDVILQMDALLEAMAQAERLAHNQAQLVHVLTWEETQAGIWEPPPEDKNAVANTNGLLLNCVNSGLYMVSIPWSF